MTENFSAYSILKHRHVPEVLRISGLEEREFSFTAQLLPVDRGILETIYFRGTGVSSAEDAGEDLRTALRQTSPSSACINPAGFPTCTPWRAPISATSG